MSIRKILPVHKKFLNVLDNLNTQKGLQWQIRENVPTICCYETTLIFMVRVTEPVIYKWIIYDADCEGKG